MDLQKYQDLLEIDKYSLDEHLMEQAELFHHVSDEYSHAVSMRDAREEELKQVDSKVELGIREEAEQSGIKITESTVKARLRETDEHKEAFNEYLKWRQYAEKLLALKDAFRQRSYMLKELVELYVSGYYADSAIKTHDKGSSDHKQEARREKIASKRRELREQRDQPA